MKSIAGTLAAPDGSVPVTRRGTVIHGYMISPDGIIWSRLFGRSLRPYNVADGYQGVALRHEGKTIRATVHSLVAEAFIGPRPAGFDVCHGDGDKSNNRFTNLRYATRTENIADKRKHGTSQDGERNQSAKLTNEQAKQIRNRRHAGALLRELAAEFGVGESCVSRISTGARRAMA